MTRRPSLGKSKTWKDEDWPRVAVVGAGAVGGYFGGMLAMAGAPVVMIGRKAFVEAVKSAGLSLETAHGLKRVTVEASDDMTAAGDAEVVLFSVKTSDTAAAARALAPALKPGATVVSLQNGVDNAEQIREAANIDTFAAAVYVSASVSRPGHIKHLARGDLVVGPEAESIATLFLRADVPCKISGNLAGELWAKLALNCALNALSGLANASYGRIIESLEGRKIVDAVADEVFAVARAASITHPSFKTADTLRAGIYDLARQMPTTMSSTAQDLVRGKLTEIDSLNGYISRRGTELGIITPVNQTLWALTKLVEGTHE